MGCGERAGEVTKGALGDYPGGFSYTGSQSSGITQKTGKSCKRIYPTRSEECGRGPEERSQQILQEHWASQLSLRENDQKDPIYEGRKGLIRVAGQCGFPRLFVLGCFPQRPTLWDSGSSEGTHTHSHTLSPGRRTPSTPTPTYSEETDTTSSLCKSTSSFRTGMGSQGLLDVERNPKSEERFQTRI